MEGKEKTLVSTSDHPKVKTLKTYHFKITDNGEVRDFECTMSNLYQDWQEKYDNFKIRPTDVFVVGVPRSGSTWTQELVWCVLHGVDSDQGKKPMGHRFLFLERDVDKGMPGGKQSRLLNNQSVLTILDNTDERRLIKSHFHMELLPMEMWTKKPKIVYICRDPRDVVVSLYFLRKKHEPNLPGVQRIVDNFLNKDSYWDHVLGFWNLRNEENILFIRYEELKEDLPGMIRKVAQFFEKNWTDEDVLSMADHLSFNSMKENAAVNKASEPSSATVDKGEKETQTRVGDFLRKGQVGDWKNHLDNDQIERFKEWTERNLKDSDFPYYRD